MSPEPTKDESYVRSRWSDRRHASTGEVVAIITLVLQLAAIVWGAASMFAAINGLREMADANQRGISNILIDVNALKVDVGILKAKP